MSEYIQFCDLPFSRIVRVYIFLVSLSIIPGFATVYVCVCLYLYVSFLTWYVRALITVNLTNIPTFYVNKALSWICVIKPLFVLGTSRFRIAAAYSNDDNKLSPNSPRFHLQPDDGESQPLAPKLFRTEAVAPTVIRIYWQVGITYSNKILHEMDFSCDITWAYSIPAQNIEFNLLKI